MHAWQAHREKVRSLAFSPDGSRLATCSQTDRRVRFWNPLGGDPLGVLVGERGTMPICLAFAPDSRLVAVVSLPNIGQHLRAWDLAGDSPRLVGELRLVWRAHDVAVAPSDPPLVCVSDLNRLRAFPGFLTDALPGGATPVVLNRGTDRTSPKARRVAASPDGRWVASNGRDRAVVWDVPALKPRHTHVFARSPQNGPVAFAPAGALLAVAHGTKVDLWPFAEPGAPVVALAGHKGPVWGVGFSPEGTFVRTASSDGTVRGFDAATGRLIRTYDFGLGKLYAAAFTADGTVGAAATGDGRVAVWDLED